MRKVHNITHMNHEKESRFAARTTAPTAMEVRSGETSRLDFSVHTASAATEIPLSELFGVDLETCQGFLDEPPPNMVSKTREFTDVAREDNPSVVSMCQTSHETIDGSGAVMVTVISFESEGSADSHFETTLPRIHRRRA